MSKFQAETVPAIYLISCCPTTVNEDDEEDDDDSTIACLACDRWFHTSCVGIPSFNAALISAFTCKDCVRNGQTKPEVSWRKNLWQHRRDPGDACGFEKVMQSGSSAFVRRFEKLNFKSAADHGKAKIFKDGSQLPFREFSRKGFFRTPLLFVDIYGLDFEVPGNDFTLADVERYVGSDFGVDIIDVETQHTYSTSLSEYISMFSAPRTRKFNMLSLEYSRTTLNELITLPAFVRSISWVENYWPKNEALWSPQVAKYCLISMSGSYTDFHIDFGGSSVYYHVVRGMKRFYVIEPTDEHLSKFQDFMTKPNSSEIFFADVVGHENVYIVDIKAGETVLIPSGWIHAVVTPEDSLVFGGNFLHMNDAGMQLKIYQMENDLGTPTRYKFYYFEEMNWFMLSHVLEILQGKRNDDCHDKFGVERAARALLKQLPIWAERDGVDLDEKFLTVDDYLSCTDMLESLQSVLDAIKREKKLTKVGTNGSQVFRKRKLAVEG